ncbi:MAG TPA: hypothetical protein VEO53_17120 [Candidatus Binatia bacterium]|nr:hypothetical protein [Candidatus Binatia bacterium]
MKESLSQWLSRRARLRGVLACGVRFPDKTSLTQCWSSEFTAPSLENAWRCASDAFQVLRLNFFPNERVRWVYEKATLHCACREDGTCLGIFTAKDRGTVDAAEIERVMSEFCALRPDAPGS